MYYVLRRMARATRKFSARWANTVVDQLQKRSEVEGVSKSRLAERYVDEGIRMDEHPGIEFRDGPTGRRAALMRGPDVWQLIATLKEFRSRGESEEEAIDATAPSCSASTPHRCARVLVTTTLSQPRSTIASLATSRGLMRPKPLGAANKRLWREAAS